MSLNLNRSKVRPPGNPAVVAAGAVVVAVGAASVAVAAAAAATVVAGAATVAVVGAGNLLLLKNFRWSRFRPETTTQLLNRN